MREEEDEESEGRPEPADLDEEDVEEVLLLCKVRWCKVCRMGLGNGAVRGGACGGIQQREKGTEE